MPAVTREAEEDWAAELPRWVGAVASGRGRERARDMLVQAPVPMSYVRLVTEADSEHNMERKPAPARTGAAVTDDQLAFFLFCVTWSIFLGAR